MHADLLAANDQEMVALATALVVFYIAVIAFGVFVYAKIVTRSGYPWPWVFIMFVPIVNIVMLCIFAFKQWPVQRELELTRRALEAATGSPFPPGSQMMTYDKYQIGSGLAGNEADYYGGDQGYAAPQGYTTPGYGAAPAGQVFGTAGPEYPAQPYGDPGQQPNPYSAPSPQQSDTPDDPRY